MPSTVAPAMRDRHPDRDQPGMKKYLRRYCIPPGGYTV